jgi:hypothetical protein
MFEVVSASWLTRVRAVRITYTRTRASAAFAFNGLETFEYAPQVSFDVFILGYPLNISGGGSFPIWKRGTIASEPSRDIDTHPKLIVDTASRPGMSGAIVIAQNSGQVLRNIPGGVQMVSAARQILGVYSGRVDDLAEAQLGIVWKWDAVLQIIDARKRARKDVPEDPPSTSQA